MVNFHLLKQHPFTTDFEKITNNSGKPFYDELDF